MDGVLRFGIRVYISSLVVMWRRWYTSSYRQKRWFGRRDAALMQGCHKKSNDTVSETDKRRTSCTPKVLVFQEGSVVCGSPIRGQRGDMHFVYGHKRGTAS